MMNSTAVRTLASSTFMFSRTRAATPSPSRTRPEEQMLRADVVVVEPLRLVLSQCQDLARAIRELVEAIHRVERLFPSPTPPEVPLRAC